MAAMSLRLSDDDSAALRRKADEEGRSVHDVARSAIRQYTTDETLSMDDVIARISDEDDKLLERLTR